MARSTLRSDLDLLEEHAQGYSGRLKLSAAGPWTLAALMERPRGDRVLADSGRAPGSRPVPHRRRARAGRRPEPAVARGRPHPPAGRARCCRPCSPGPCPRPAASPGTASSTSRRWAGPSPPSCSGWPRSRCRCGCTAARRRCPIPLLHDAGVGAGLARPRPGHDPDLGPDRHRAQPGAVAGRRGAAHRPGADAPTRSPTGYSTRFADSAWIRRSPVSSSSPRPAAWPGRPGTRPSSRSGCFVRRPGSSPSSWPSDPEGAVARAE